MRVKNCHLPLRPASSRLKHLRDARYPDYKAWVDRKATEIKTAREAAAKTRQEIDRQNQQNPG